MKNQLFLLFFLFSITFTISQEKKKAILKPYKIGFLYNYGTNENFLFDDVDYTYSTQTYKGQLFYKLRTWKNWDFELIAQPQIQFLNHQLINEQFITPDQENYLEKRVEFTQSKKMNLYGNEFGFAGIKKITQNVYFQGSLSLGFTVVNTRTERLAKGFTFIENLSLGILYKTTSKSQFYLGTNFGHVSNLDSQKPNDGYNILGLEIGYNYILN
jgi:hypothetical protein